MHPLVRWQYRGGIPEPERKAFLFTQPTDSQGPPLRHARCWSAGLAANRDVYRIGFGKPLEEIGAGLGQSHRRSDRAARGHRCAVPGGRDHRRRSRRDGSALDGLPVPISTPGWDNAPYLSAGHYITKDPETGIQNVGNYRGQLKAPRRLGMNPSVELRAGIYRALAEMQGARRAAALRRRGRLPAGRFPTPRCRRCRRISTRSRSPARLPADRSMWCAPKTVDLMVPAEAEIVIEGLINTELLEPEAPFGESHGYVNLQEYNAFMEVTAITRRRTSDPHLLHQPGDAERIERDPPGGDGAGLSSSSHVGAAASSGVKRVAMHEPLTSLYAVIAIQFARGTPETRNLARAPRRGVAAPLCRQMDHRGRRGHRAGKRRRAVLGDVVSLPAAARSQGGAAQGSRPRAARPARRRRKRGRADQRDAQGHLCAGRAAEARVHGARARRSGSGSAAAAHAAAAVARL